MKKTNKIIVGAILVATLCLGIGYAAIQNITLNITGTASADPSQADYKVMFTGAPIVSDETLATAAITDDINATINVSGLKTAGQLVTVDYIIQNTSSDLSADLSVSTTNSNTEYFMLSSELDKVSLIAGEATTVKVKVELIKNPITSNENATIGIQLTSIPVQPGEEGSSNLTNDYSQTPESLVLVTNSEIGEYIDLGNNIIGTESTADDWRILYRDTDRVYAILADYLPADQVPVAANLTTDPTNYPYNVWSDEDRNAFFTGIKFEDAWHGFTNGLSGATAIGSPTAELLMNSYNAKNNDNLVYTDYPILDSTTTDYDLYVPNSVFVNGCTGYWLANIVETYDSGVWVVDNGGAVRYGSWSSDYKKFSVRPIVALPLDLICSYENNIWTIK